jgi:hypothetical protein
MNSKVSDFYQENAGKLLICRTGRMRRVSVGRFFTLSGLIFQPVWNRFPLFTCCVYKVKIYTYGPPHVFIS